MGNDVSVNTAQDQVFFEKKKKQLHARKYFVFLKKNNINSGHHSCHVLEVRVTKLHRTETHSHSYTQEFQEV